MFIIDFMGGLGNQMFEYAFYKKMKKKYPHTKIYSDLTNTKKFFNGFELTNLFGINVNPIEDWLLISTLSDNYHDKAKYAFIFKKLNIIRKYLFGPKNSHIKQDDYTAFYPEIFHLNPLYSYYISGVWANTLYFNDIREELIKDFSFVKELNEKNEIYKKKILETESVGIHFRRGDYLKANKTALLNDSYFLEAIKICFQKLKKPQFYVFSDDIVAAKKLFKKEIANFIFVEGNVGDSSYVDMELMSLCKHNILSNSSFSFWAAYLNQNISKLVIASKTPFQNCSQPFACDDWLML